MSVRGGSAASGGIRLPASRTCEDGRDTSIGMASSRNVRPPFHGRQPTADSRPTTYSHAALKDVHTQQRPAGLWQSKSAIKADDQLNLGMARLFETRGRGRLDGAARHRDYPVMRHRANAASLGECAGGLAGLPAGRPLAGKSLASPGVCAVR